jgi:phage tail-like protein
MAQNLEHLYTHLPARFQREDEGLFLKRFLHFFGIEFDNFDLIFDTFFEKINPDTAPESFLDWWLWALYGWAWFPSWFTLQQKRHLYKDMATHYARRGTKRGIEEFLRAFGLHVRVFNQPQYWGEAVFGEDVWTMTGPLAIVVQVFPEAAAIPADQSFWGEFAWGEAVFANPAKQVERADLERLLRFQWPIGHTIMIEDKTIPVTTP